MTGWELFNRGVGAYHARKFEEVIEFFQQAVALSPDEGIYWGFLGLIYTWVGNYAQAEDALNRSIALDSDNLMLYDFRGQLRSILKQYALAIEDYEQAIALDVDDTYFYGAGTPENLLISLAEAYENLGNYQAAITNYELYEIYSGHRHYVRHNIEALEQKLKDIDNQEEH